MRILMISAAAIMVASAGFANAGPIGPVSTGDTGAITRVQAKVEKTDKAEKKETATEKVTKKVKRTWRNWTGTKFDVGCPTLAVAINRTTCTATGKKADAMAKCQQEHPLCQIAEHKR